MKVFEFENGHEAWASINRLFIEQENGFLFEGEQGASITNSLYTYGLSIFIKNAEFDPEFDFGKILGYTQSKWSSLLNNYLDLDSLDKLKLQIREFEKNKAVNRNYHIGFNFADSHGNGKGCLMSGIFSRMIGIEKPRLTILMRASDIVTRLPWDLLLSIRMGEYVYGKGNFNLVIHFNQMDYYFSVGFTSKVIAFPGKLFTKVHIVFNDTVMHHSEPAIIAGVGMGIGFCWRTVGCPAGVADSGHAW